MLLGAGDPWTDAASQDLLGYARALSLDLRGVVPAQDELMDIEADGEVTDQRLDEWLHSSAFEEQVIRKHRELFWNQLAVNLLPRRKLFPRDGIYYNNQRSRHTRGVRLTHCGDFPANVDALNRPLTWQENEENAKRSI